jgi:trehalose 6-phosphate synthase/phosphatase
VPAEHHEAVQKYAQAKFKARPVFLSEENVSRFYLGFSNRTLWPLFHYFPSLTRYEEEFWQECRCVNQIFCDALLAMLGPGDLVWVHDYQFMLLPRLIRERLPDLPIGFFLHIPFPSFEMFRLLPGAWRAERLEGMLGAGLIGFMNIARATGKQISARLLRWCQKLMDRC